MIFQFIRSGMVRNRTYLVSSFLLCCSITAVNVSFAADRLEITDEYLQGLSEEISSPEYVTQAKRNCVKPRNRNSRWIRQARRLPWHSPTSSPLSR